MRKTLLLLLVFPSFLNAQINRSATELAREKIREYIETKLFKDMPYQAVSYGEMKSYKEPNSAITWTIVHDFEITETQMIADKKIAVKKPYHFYFYLDKRIKVLRSERIQNY